METLVLRKADKVVKMCLCTFLSTFAFSSSTAFAQSDPLAQAEQRVRQHTQKILQQLPQGEQRAQRIIEQAQKDAVGKVYTFNEQKIDAAKEHPWIEANPSTGGNPNTAGDYSRDTFMSINATATLPQTWSCFEPQLLAKGWWYTAPDEISPASADLAAVCKASCPPLPPPLPDNGYEVIQFWWPEHHIAVNNYARARFDPSMGGPHGSNYTRQKLLAAKENGPEKMMKEQLAQNYPLNMDGFQAPLRDNPFKGQGMWGGDTGDNNDRLNAHVYRTLIGVALGDAKPQGLEFFFGWLWNPRSIYLSLPPPSSAKPIANLWTEYGAFEAITAVPQMSYMAGSRGAQAMNALFGPKGQASQIARNNPTFYQTQSSTAFRVGRWGRDYGALQEVANISPNQSAALREVVYHGGQELFPLTLSLESFETANMSVFSIMARRAAHLAGAKELAQYLPGGEQSRMVEFTVSGFDKGREIDKLQRIYPLKGPPTECYRSQRIPNMVEQTEDGWVKQNFPHDLMGYVKDDYGDVAYTYWNKRVACTCRVLGVFGGSWPMDFPLDSFGPGRGTGDRPYGKIEAPLCQYFETELPSGFAGRDKPACPTGQFRNYKGLDDTV